ncbi:macrophage mannose receptor 1-like isoform X3 [Leptotrombidium deliense]|uniref:Macrophage mannose receptor 1-like isoform X3 n=1 Tax=Leptotrombidium deliense TaxID=299467 RepID=A0A443RYI1_9ACAR|nr:macrophage mannose receptor 1-like isoform X3 [Leptotrombidium deliense]
MAFIHMQEEHNFLKSIIKRPTPHWIGFRQLAPFSKSFLWIDGSDVDYVSWAQNQPNLRTGKQQREQHEMNTCFAAVLHPLKNHGWTDEPCSSEYHTICQIDYTSTEVMTNPSTIVSELILNQIELQSQINQFKKVMNENRKENDLNLFECKENNVKTKLVLSKRVAAVEERLESVNDLIDHNCTANIVEITTDMNIYRVLYFVRIWMFVLSVSVAAVILLLISQTIRC